MRQLFLILFFWTGASLHAQTWQWAVKSVTTSAKQDAGKMTSDLFGNIYLLGSSSAMLTYGSFQLNPGNYLVKYDPTGNVVFARNLVHPAFLISSDNSGNLYISDNYSGTVATASSSFTSVGDQDMLLVKLDAFGNEIWARSYGGPSKEEVTDMVTDINGNSYLTGFYKSDSLNFYNVSKIDTTHYGHFFIAQINNNGNTQWINRGVQDTTYRYYNWGRHLALDKFERPYVIMEASQYPNMGGWGYALAKYDLTGKMYFNKFAWIGLTIQVAGLQVDDDLNIYTVMAAGTHADQGDLYKYDSSLTSTKWTYWLGPQYGCFGFYDPRVKPNGECFLTGRLGNPDDQVANCYNQAADSVGVPFGVLPLKGLYDVAVAKLTNNGKLAWYASAGGAGVDDAVSSHIDGSGNFYLSGVYNYTNQYFGTLNNTTQFSNWTLYPDGPWQQSFLAKLGDNNPVGMKEINAGTAIRLFPNPCKDQFVIDSEEGSGHFRIYNELGVLVLEDDFARGKSIDVRRFPAGLYIVDIADNSRRSVRKIVIE